MNTENLRELTLDEVKSWLQSQEMMQNAEFDWESIRKIQKYFFPNAVKLEMKLGSEWNDSDYGPVIGEVVGRDKDGGEIQLPDLSEFDNELRDPVLMIKSKYKDLYLGYGNFDTYQTMPYSIEGIYCDMKTRCVSFENSSVFCNSTSPIIFNIENETVESPVVPKIYGDKNDFVD